MIRYNHTQRAYPILISLILAIILFTFLPLMGMQIRVAGFLIALICGLVFVFGSMTVTVSSDALKISFGIGLIHRTIRLADMISVKTVSNPWYLGWGIHKIRHGWIYNVSGFQGIEITLNNSRIVRIGSDEPDELAQCLHAALSQMDEKLHTDRSIRSNVSA